MQPPRGEWNKGKGSTEHTEIFLAVYFFHVFLCHKHRRENNLDQTQKRDHQISLSCLPGLLYSTIWHLNNKIYKTTGVFAFGPWSTIKCQFRPSVGKCLGTPFYNLL